MVQISYIIRKRNDWTDTELSSPAYMKAFAERLKAARVIAGFDDARAFARHMGIDDNRYRKYERGETSPPLELLVEISKATETSLQFLLTGQR